MNLNYLSGLLLLFTLLVTGVDKKTFRIGITVLVMVICDSISMIIGNNPLYYHVYTVIEYSLFSFILLEFQHEYKGLIRVGLLLGLAGIVYLETFALSKYDTLAVALECGIIFLLCLKSIYALTIYKIIPLLKDYRFYFLVGIAQYTFFTSFVFIGANSFPELTTVLHSFFNIILNLSIATSIIVHKRREICLRAKLL